MGASKCLLIFLTMIEHYYLIAIALNWLASLWKFAIIIWMHISLGGACQRYTYRVLQTIQMKLILLCV